MIATVIAAVLAFALYIVGRYIRHPRGLRGHRRPGYQWSDPVELPRQQAESLSESAARKILHGRGLADMSEAEVDAITFGNLLREDD